MLSRQALRTFRAAAPVARAPMAVRTYAAAATENVQPPIAVYGLDGTYATALVCHPPCPERPSKQNTLEGTNWAPPPPRDDGALEKHTG